MRRRRDQTGRFWHLFEQGLQIIQTDQPSFLEMNPTRQPGLFDDILPNQLINSAALSRAEGYVLAVCRLQIHREAADAASTTFGCPEKSPSVAR